jgi:SAM-dependent methyltransferase
MQLADILPQLYERQLAATPGDGYLRQHGEHGFLEGTIRVFRFYEPWLPTQGRILDWGCRHAPDACLIRAKLGDRVTLDGCDVADENQYAAFFTYAGLRYFRLQNPVRLPYEDSSFDAIIASGVLEHVPMDYESLKELNRILKPKGRLIVAYLPNRASLEEWWLRLRDRGDFHRRLYGYREMNHMLLHSGFLPLVAGYQTQLDMLRPPGGRARRMIRVLARLLQAHRLTACLCAVAEKTSYF